MWDMARSRHRATVAPPYVAVRGPCDLRCAFCNARGERHLEIQGELERITAELEGLVREGHREVGLGLAHSEPTTYPELLEVVRRARRLGFDHITLSTSGLSLVDSSATARIAQAGVTAVNLTFAGLDDEVTDLLLGYEGASAAKLRALEVCLGEGLEVFANLALLRPTLASLPELCKTVRSRADAESATLHLTALFLDPVAGMEPERVELLWPRLGEARWAMARLRAIAPDVGLLAHDLPRCVREAIPGLRVYQESKGSARPPARKRYIDGGPCDDCRHLNECDGFDEVLVEAQRDVHPAQLLEERAPPEVDIEVLRDALAAFRGSSTSLAAGILPLRVAPLLVHMARGRHAIRGFQLDEVGVGLDDLSVTLHGGGERVAVRLSPATSTSKCFLSGELVALSYRSETPINTPQKLDALRALLALVEETLKRNP